ncbi:MAG: septal ring lytic transglycosylase RlpA family protein [Gammaproteobacteria bacterium]|nr:septal ring lytic transglycosylase RlpA family protein [Gammaproteobacteria bacterium]
MSRAARWTLALTTALLAACGTLPQARAPAPVPVPVPSPPAAPPPPRDLAAIPDAVPRAEPRSRYGNPSSYVVFGRRYYLLASAEGHVERGTASWYGPGFHAARTSSGEPYDMYAMTAAHKTLPIPAYARVTNLRNGRSVIVRINDRGPFVGGRIIDLSYTAAWKLDMLRTGTAPVEVRVLSPGADVPPTLTAATGAPAPTTPPTAASTPANAALQPPARATASPTTAPPTAALPTVTPTTPSTVAPAATPTTSTMAANAVTAEAAPAAVSAGSPLPPLAATAGNAAAIAAAAVPATMLQVGAFFGEGNARTLVARLAAAGIGNAIVRPTRSGSRTIWQVRVGPLEGALEVDDMRERLRLAGITDAHRALD